MRLRCLETTRLEEKIADCVWGGVFFVLFFVFFRIFCYFRVFEVESC